MGLLGKTARLAGQIAAYAVALAEVHHAIEAWDLAVTILKRNKAKANCQKEHPLTKAGRFAGSKKTPACDNSGLEATTP